MREAQDFLNRAFKIDRELRRLELVRADLRAQLYSYGGMALGERVQTSPERDKLGRIMGKIDAQEREILDRMEALTAAKKEIEDAIRGMQNERRRQLLTARYVALMKWDDVAEWMGIEDRRYLFRMHRRALEEFEDLPYRK